MKTSTLFTAALAVSSLVQATDPSKLNETTGVTVVTVTHTTYIDAIIASNPPAGPSPPTGFYPSPPTGLHPSPGGLCPSALLATEPAQLGARADWEKARDKAISRGRAQAEQGRQNGQAAWEMDKRDWVDDVVSAQSAAASAQAAASSYRSQASAILSSASAAAKSAADSWDGWNNGGGKGGKGGHDSDDEGADAKEDARTWVASSSSPTASAPANSSQPTSASVSAMTRVSGGNGGLRFTERVALAFAGFAVAVGAVAVL